MRLRHESHLFMCLSRKFRTFRLPVQGVRHRGQSGSLELKMWREREPRNSCSTQLKLMTESVFGNSRR